MFLDRPQIVQCQRHGGRGCGRRTGNARAADGVTGKAASQSIPACPATRRGHGLHPQADQRLPLRRCPRDRRTPDRHASDKLNYAQCRQHLRRPPLRNRRPVPSGTFPSWLSRLSHNRKHIPGSCRADGRTCARCCRGPPGRHGGGSTRRGARGRPLRPSWPPASSRIRRRRPLVPAARAGGSADQLCGSAQPRLTLQRPHELEPSRNTGALVAIPLSGSEPLTSLLR